MKQSEKKRKLKWEKKSAEVAIERVDNIDRFVVKCTECNTLLSIPLIMIQTFAKQNEEPAGAMYA